MPAYIGKLTNIAAESGAVANEVRALQQRLVDAYSKSPMRAAAAPGEEKVHN